LQTDHEEIPEQVGIDVLGPPAHVVLLEAADSFTNRGFDFSLRLHRTPPDGGIAKQTFSPAAGA
jgi:hypothetical protein